MAAPIKRVPTNAPKPQDHKPKKSTEARKAEAEDGFVTIEQCGVELRIPLAGKIPIAVVDMFNAGENYEAIKTLIGAEQWRKLSDAGMTIDDLNELDRKVQEASGNS